MAQSGTQILAGIATLIFSLSVFAGGHHDRDRDDRGRDRSRDRDRVWRETKKHPTRVQKHQRHGSEFYREMAAKWWKKKPYKGNHGSNGGSSSGGSTLPTTPQPKCGDVITASIRLTKSLDCSSTPGFALYVIGDNIIVDGSNSNKNKSDYSIKGMDGGIYVSGNNITVRDVRMTGMTNGFGIMTWESNGLVFANNDLSDNYIGISLNADLKVVDNVKVYGNTIRRTGAAAVWTGMDFEKTGKIVNPRIYENDFSESKNFAIMIQASEYETSDRDRNDYKNSENGIYVGKGVYYIHDLSLENEDIGGQKIFAAGSDELTIHNVNVSSFDDRRARCGRDNDQEVEETSIGLDMWGVRHFTINRLTSRNNAVGIYVEARDGFLSEGSVTCSYFSNNTSAGILVASFGILPPYGIGEIEFQGNIFNLADDVFDILNL